MKDFFKKYRELIVYIIVGGLTTVANYIIHFGLRFLGANYYVALSAAWFGAVIFAYIANRVFVLKARQKARHKLKSLHFSLAQDYSHTDSKCLFRSYLLI